MRRDWIRQGLGTGIIAAAATAGALLRIGMSLGAAARPFNAIASVLAGPPAALRRDPGALTLLGIAVHVAIVVAWALVYEWLGALGRGGRWWRAFALAALWVVVSSLVARIAGVGLSSVLGVGERIIVALVLAIALAIGMALAFPRPRRR